MLLFIFQNVSRRIRWDLEGGLNINKSKYFAFPPNEPRITSYKCKFSRIMISRHRESVPSILRPVHGAPWAAYFSFFGEVLMSCNERQSLSFMWSQRRVSRRSWPIREKRCCHSDQPEEAAIRGFDCDALMCWCLL